MQKPTDNSYHPPAPNFYSGHGMVVATHANLPHWNKAITASFVTFRLADSLPREELLKRLEGRGSALPSASHWRDNLVSEAVRRPLPRPVRGSALPSASQVVFRGSALPSASQVVFRGSALPSASYSPTEDAIQEYLDAGHGSCVLKDEHCRQVVEDALWHFAGERYHLYAYVVMPNHVHVLFMPMEGQSLSGTVASWKKFTARQINDVLGREGTLWQKESFDTLVRSERHFKEILKYIRENDLRRSWAYNMIF